MDRQKIIKLAREIYNNGGYAVQNAEHDNERAVMKYQALSQQALEELAAYLEVDPYR